MASENIRPGNRKARLARPGQTYRFPVLIVVGAVNGISTFRALAMDKPGIKIGTRIT
ncbi:hypothetical protein ACQPT2_03740 [Erwinia amylovora]